MARPQLYERLVDFSQDGVRWESDTCRAGELDIVSNRDTMRGEGQRSLDCQAHISPANPLREEVGQK